MQDKEFRLLKEDSSQSVSFLCSRSLDSNLAVALAHSKACAMDLHIACAKEMRKHKTGLDARI